MIHLQLPGLVTHPRKPSFSNHSHHCLAGAHEITAMPPTNRLSSAWDKRNQVSSCSWPAPTPASALEVALSIHSLPHLAAGEVGAGEYQAGPGQTQLRWTHGIFSSFSASAVRVQKERACLTSGKGDLPERKWSQPQKTTPHTGGPSYYPASRPGLLLRLEGYTKFGGAAVLSLPTTHCIPSVVLILLTPPALQWAQDPPTAHVLCSALPMGVFLWAYHWTSPLCPSSMPPGHLVLGLRFPEGVNPISQSVFHTPHLQMLTMDRHQADPAWVAGGDWHLLSQPKERSLEAGSRVGMECGGAALQGSRPLPPS